MLRGMYLPDKFSFDLKDPALFVATAHPQNSCPKNFNTISWKPATLPEFKRI